MSCNSSNVWVISSAGTSAWTTSEVIIRGIRWVGATTAGHNAMITDTNGCIKWYSVANAANYVEADGPRIKTYGIKVPTLDSGTLFLEVE